MPATVDVFWREILVAQYINPRGADGPAGAAGAPGAPGAPGTNGTNGTSATVTAGTTTGLPFGSPATVTNVGTTSAAILDFGIPAGQPSTDDTFLKVFKFNHFV